MLKLSMSRSKVRSPAWFLFHVFQSWCSIQSMFKAGWYPDVKRVIFNPWYSMGVLTTTYAPRSLYYIYILYYIYVYLCCLRMGDPYFTILAEIQFDYLTLTVSFWGQIIQIIQQASPWFIATMYNHNFCWDIP